MSTDAFMTEPQSDLRLVGADRLTLPTAVRPAARYQGVAVVTTQTTRSA